jgi:hypothetical protein
MPYAANLSCPLIDQMKSGPGTIYSPRIRCKSFAQRSTPSGFNSLTILKSVVLYFVISIYIYIFLKSNQTVKHVFLLRENELAIVFSYTP